MAVATSATRDLLLTSIAAIYLPAFLSLYYQMPGLFGASGVLPAHTQLTVNGTSVAEAILARPTLLWWRGLLGLNTLQAMEAMALVGILLSLLAVLFELFRTSLTYAVLVVVYASLVQVGQVFLFFQWDTLLMETGLLAVLLAPALPRRVSNPRPSGDGLSLWLFRWLLFRVVFSTGVVKMQSFCPAWWGLTALETHFESQALPTPLALYAHHLPASLLRISTVLSMVIELAGPFLVFAPIRRIRLAGFYLQVFLQLNMVATGNFGFHSFLILVLCLSLLDDDWLRGKRSSRAESGVLTRVSALALLSAVLLATVALFQLRVSATDGITSKIAFSHSDFSEFVRLAVPGSVLLALASFLLTAAESVATAAADSGSFLRRMDAVLRTTAAVIVAAAVFACTLVPYTMLEVQTHRALPRALRTGFSDHVRNFHVFGSYGIFQQMTGVGGRPEVVLEGSNSLQGPWQEIEFLYKPGDVTTRPAFVAPHQPRLDWHMWLAALSDYHSNSWVTSLAYRLLTGEPEVVRLLDSEKYPFADKPPKYIRGLLYKYHYNTLPNSKNSWWVRDDVPEEYLPVFSAKHQPLLDYLREIKIIDAPEAEPAAPCLPLIGALDGARGFINQSGTSPHFLIWAVLLTCFVINLTRRYVL